MADNNKKKRSLKAFLQNKLKSRSTRHGAMSLGFAALAVAAAILLNVIAGLLSDRFPGMKADFTANQAYALSDDTMEYIRHMDKDVALHIIADESTFTGGGRYFVQAKNLLDKMVSASDGKFTYDFVDTTENPAFTRNYPNIDWSQRFERADEFAPVCQRERVASAVADRLDRIDFLLAADAVPD